MRPFRTVLLALVGVAVLGAGGIYAIVRNHGLAADRAPGVVETAIARRVVLLSTMPPATGAHVARAAAHGDRPNIIAMDGTAFEPRALEVRAGDAVVWINKDPFPHNVSSSPGGIHSGDLDPDRQWEFRPTRPGTYSYVCTLHPGMNGRLIVTK